MAGLGYEWAEKYEHEYACIPVYLHLGEKHPVEEKYKN